MDRLHGSYINKKGNPPGALVHVGHKKAEQVMFTVVNYARNNFSIQKFQDVDHCISAIDRKNITWVIIDGLHDTNAISAIGEFFQLHKLTIEDVLNTMHRPKFESFEQYVFLTMKHLTPVVKQPMLQEQISHVLGENWVITFREQASSVFEPLLNRIQEDKNQVRRNGADYLLYRLTDILIDEYVVISSLLTERVLILEEEVLEKQSDDILKEIQSTRKELIRMRRAITPLREAMMMIQRGERHSVLGDSSQHYFSDVYGHLVHVSESLSNQMDFVGMVMDYYMTSVSNKTNSVMQLLTIISTIFIPLTFIAGIYGMNFQNIPELGWSNGYFIALGVMAGIALGLVFFFWRKKWL